MMVEYKDQLQRVSHLRCFGMYQCAGKDKVRVRSFGEGKDLYLSKKEIFEFADNIKDWCKDMVDPPVEDEVPSVEKEEILGISSPSSQTITLYNWFCELTSKLEKRVDGIEKAYWRMCE